MRSLCLASFVACWVIVGCDRAPVTSPATAPATAPALARADSPDSEPATQPQAAHMLIDGRRVEFPPAKLAVRTRGGHVLAVLYSDDPPEAIHDNYTGNSFYIEMLLDITDPNELGTAHWSFKAPSSDRADTVTGIYLDGRKRQLQPSDVVVQFDGSASPLAVLLRGTFLMFESSHDHTIPGKIVPVVGELEVEVTIKSASR